MKSVKSIRRGPPEADEEATGGGGRTYTVPALEKSLDVIEFLAVQDQPVSQSGIAQSLGRSASELFRILTVLTRRGWITRLKDDNYQLSSRLFELAHGYPPNKRLIDVALPLMRGLAGDLLQSCHLSVADQGEVLVIIGVESPGRAGLFVRSGTRYEFASTASGRVMLALGYAEMLNGNATGKAERRPVPDDLAARLERIRTRGYEEVVGEWLDAVVDICWPVFNVRGEVAAVLAMPFLAVPALRQDVASAREQVRAVAEEISRAIGAGDYQRWLDEARQKGLSRQNPTASR
ncbi:IclR family transcriptional regulator [Chelatococcus asaccharovorans]|uniref:IclR family transcriptional regulator n=1 Tax=Chelatococcus asaccharovorans TaxID=28210 RepID=A0A2V3UBE8_9HYPH|nr:IclR family transcriptional regulator [Chelatococcus asaccharovorans]MBS7705398.1 IclR family transcriptional regulator [Chelatococcus asaccharovorans]PXW60198.1 IclR family transcriptional regulator [Chelatococcus asaccharovorans]